MKAGVALSVALIAAWYAARLAGFGCEQVDHGGGALGLHERAELRGRTAVALIRLGARSRLTALLTVVLTT